jgi:hypothetical protein
MSDIWSFRVEGWTDDTDLVGYDVEATDGSIGKIDDATNDADRQHVVVDTGFWIFGKKRLIPAGAITRIEHGDKKLYVDMTKDQIKEAPDFDETSSDDDRHRSTHEEYYRPYSSRGTSSQQRSV